MPYVPQTWADNDLSKPLSASRMNTIEAGIQTAQSTAEAAQTAASGAQSTANTKPSVGLVLALGG
jgi:hypothetical protein